MEKPIIAVVGGTGAQGGGVVDALLHRGRFSIRVLTRNPGGAKAQELERRGVEVVRGDLNDPSTLVGAFAGAYGAFIMTNFWDPATNAPYGDGTGISEADQGEAAVTAAREAGIQHVIWSTLPDVRGLSGGKLAVHHFTGKAAVDALVAAAGFPFHTFVEPPFYFQNLATMMQPQPLGDGTKGWVVPMDPAKPSIHAGDVTEVGQVVARAFEQPDVVGQGQHLGVAPGLISWTDIVAAFNAQGHDVVVRQVPSEVYDGLFTGAKELREMFQWFEGYTYFGPDAEEKLANTRAVHPEPLTGLSEWAAEHLTA